MTPSKPIFSEPAPDEALQHVEASAGFSLEALMMNVLAAIITCYGLVQNNSALVLVAAIIASQSGPVAGAGLALAQGSLMLLQRALKTLVVAIPCVMGVAYAFGTLNASQPMTDALRTHGTLTLEAFIAACAIGFACAYAQARPALAKLAAIAISYALLPPLAVAGVFFARGDGVDAYAALTLYGITLATMVITAFLVFAFSERREFWKVAVLPRLATLAAVAALTLALAVHVYPLAKEHRLHAAAYRVMAEQLRAYPGATLTTLTMADVNGVMQFTAVVRSPFIIGPEDVEVLEDALSATLVKSVNLYVRSLPMQEADRFRFHYPEVPTGEKVKDEGEGAKEEELMPESLPAAE